MVLSGPSARAEWTAINLHPAGEPAGSFLLGVADGQQVGAVHRIEDMATRAGVWSGTADSYVGLNPPGMLSLARGVSQGKQVGYLDSINFQRHAVIWSGAAGSYVDLHPAGTQGSEAWGVRGNQQVGQVILSPQSYEPHASLWTGTAASWVDLHPANARNSAAYGVDGNQQVGSVAPADDHGHASLWTGTAASWVDLEPATPVGSFPIEVSVANAVHGGQQAGTVTYLAFGASVDHAGYWNGTAESWVDLNPDPTYVFTESRANAVFGGYQVGQADVPTLGEGGEHAAFWHGTPESWVDLESFLPANYFGSNAFGVWVDGDTIYVAGGAFNNDLNRTEAILWTNTVPEPATAVMLACAALSVFAGRRRRLRRLLESTIGGRDRKVDHALTSE